MDYPIMWQHDDGRTITIYSDRKVRSNYTPRDRGIGSPLRDEWPILWRSDVPALTDEQWYAAPEETGWRQNVISSTVCPNCGQWQDVTTGDCLNECHKRGLV